jgi:DNA gyrase/topoisomerase IV subunit B
MSESEEAVVTPSTEHFTEIKAYFDIDRFPADSFNLTFARMIEMRCAELAAMGADMHNPLQVSWTTRFQEDGKSVEWHNNFVFRTFQDYLKLWPNCETMIVDDNPRFKIAITPSLGSQESIALVNSIRCDWGTHTDAYVNACVYHIKNYLNNKFKVDVWPSKIKSYIKTISTWQIDAPTFSGQTKEQLVTPIDEFGMPVMPSEAFIKKLLKSPIVSAMVEDLHNKIMQQKKAELAQQQKALDKAAKRNIFPTKLTDAARAGKPGCDIFVVEGDSAAGGFKRYRHAEHQGVFAMFGKSCGNMLYADEFKVLNNKSQAWLMQALGLSFTNKNRLRYDRIIMAQDADYDGYSILGLMLVFYNKFFPELIDNGNLYRLLTPIVSAKRGKEKQIFYNLADFEAVAKDLAKQKFEIKYIKGLASLSDDDYEDIMNNPQLVRITRDDLADDSVTAWFGKESYRRKELMGMADLADDFFGDLQAEIESEFNDLDSFASDFTLIDL